MTSESIFLLGRKFNAASERKTTLFLIHRLMRQVKSLTGSKNVPLNSMIMMRSATCKTVISVRAADTGIIGFLGNTLSVFVCWLRKSTLVLSAVYSSNKPTTEN